MQKYSNYGKLPNNAIKNRLIVEIVVFFCFLLITFAPSLLSEGMLTVLVFKLLKI